MIASRLVGKKLNVARLSHTGSSVEISHPPKRFHNALFSSKSFGHVSVVRIPIRSSDRVTITFPIFRSEMFDIVLFGESFLSSSDQNGSNEF